MDWRRIHISSSIETDIYIYTCAGFFTIELCTVDSIYALCVYRLCLKMLWTISQHQQLPLHQCLYTFHRPSMFLASRMLPVSWCVLLCIVLASVTKRRHLSSVIHCVSSVQPCHRCTALHATCHRNCHHCVRVLPRSRLHATQSTCVAPNYLIICWLACCPSSQLSLQRMTWNPLLNWIDTVLGC